VPDLATQVCQVFDVDSEHVNLLGKVAAQTPDPSGLDKTTVTVAWAVVPPTGMLPIVRPPVLGELTVAAGHPDALHAIQISSSFVTATGMRELGAKWTGAFMSDYSSNGGGSGGPVFNGDCEWVGLHVGGFTDGLELSIALPF
jgi:hypothetical protein